MKRDMDLIRKILIEMENCEEIYGPGDIDIEGYPSVVLHYHVYLLDQAGYLTASVSETNEGIDATPIYLTWKGHEFLDAIKNDTVWNHVKSEIKRKLVSAPVEMIYQLCLQSLTLLQANGTF